MKKSILALLLILTMLVSSSCTVGGGSVGGGNSDGTNGGTDASGGDGGSTDNGTSAPPSDGDQGIEETPAESSINVSTNARYSIWVNTESSISLAHLFFSSFDAENEYDKQQNDSAYVSVDAEPVKLLDDSITLRIYYALDESVREDHDPEGLYSSLTISNPAGEKIYAHQITDFYDDDNYIDVKGKWGYVTNDIFKKHVDVTVPLDFLISDYVNWLTVQLYVSTDDMKSYKGTKIITYSTPNSTRENYSISLNELTAEGEEKLVDLLRVKYAHLWIRYPDEDCFVNFSEPPSVTDSEKEVLFASAAKYDPSNPYELELSGNYYDAINNYTPGSLICRLAEGELIQNIIGQAGATLIPLTYSINGDALELVCQFAYPDETIREFKRTGCRFYYEIAHRDAEGNRRVLAHIDIEDVYSNANYVLKERNGDGSYRLDVDSYAAGQRISLPLEWFSYRSVLPYGKALSSITISLYKSDKNGQTLQKGSLVLNYLGRADKVYIEGYYLEPEASYGKKTEALGE